MSRGRAGQGKPKASVGSDGAALAVGLHSQLPSQAILRHTKVPHIELFSKRLGKIAETQSEMAKTEGGGQLQRPK